MKSSFDAPVGHWFGVFVGKNVRELIDQDSKQMAYKSINGHAPQYMSNIFHKKLSLQLSQPSIYENRLEATTENIRKWANMFFVSRCKTVEQPPNSD